MYSSISTFLLHFCRVLLKMENYILLTFSHSIRLLAIDRIQCNKNVGIKFSAHGAFVKQPSSCMLKIERMES